MTASQKTAPGVAGRFCRQRAWLNRSAPGVSSLSWRSRPTYRHGAKRWLSNLDLQVQWATPWHTGLAHLRPTDDSRWSEWRRWPHAIVTMDLGSDGSSGMYAAMYKYGLNVSLRADPTLAGTRDFDLMLKMLQLKGSWCVMCIVWNLPHGVDAEETRNHQLCEAMAACFEKHPYATLPLFLSQTGDLIETFKVVGHQFDELGEVSADEQCWQLMRSRTWYSHLGREVQLARYHVGLHKCRSQAKHLAVGRFERTFTALELDFLGGRRYAETFRAKLGPAEEINEGGGSTSDARVTIVERSLLGACPQACAVRVWALSDDHNLRVCLILGVLGAELLGWHGDQNRRLRSAADNRAWAIEQLGHGHIFDHIRNAVALLTSPAPLHEIRFIVSASILEQLYLDEIGVEDEFAKIFFLGTMGLACLRCRRLLWMTHGWPAMFNECLIASKAPTVLAQFRDGIGMFDDFTRITGGSVAEALIFGRHLLHRTEAGFDATIAAGVSAVEQI